MNERDMSFLLLFLRLVLSLLLLAPGIQELFALRGPVSFPGAGYAAWVASRTAPSWLAPFAALMALVLVYVKVAAGFACLGDFRPLWTRIAVAAAVILTLIVDALQEAVGVATEYATVLIPVAVAWVWLRSFHSGMVRGES